MRSTFGGLNTMLLGLYAQQTGLDTVGHNVSNASTEGYSRQTVNLSATDPQTIYANGRSYQIGSGVQVQSVIRARDIYIDKQMWKEISTLNNAQSNETYLSKIESIFGENSTTGMQSVLNSFWSSWQTLSTNASDDGTRTTVRERGVELANAIQLAAKQLKNAGNDINSAVDLKINKINQITAEMASLNKQIVNVEAGGTDHANDLRDKRDLLVDQLSALVDTRVYEEANGSYTVQSGGTTLVNGNSSATLKTEKVQDTDYNDYEITSKIYVDGMPGQSLKFTNGEIKSLLDMQQSDQTGLKMYLNSLSTMSQFLLQDFNAVHRSGYGTDNSTNNNFFGKSTTDYASNATSSYTKNDWIKALEVNPDILVDGGNAKIAAKSSGGGIGVTQTNASGSTATVFATGKYTMGTTPTAVMVKVTNPATPGSINTIQYSTDGGHTWNGTDIALDANHHAQVPINGLSVDLYFSANTNNVSGDTYSFSLTNHSADSNFVISQSNAGGGAANIVSATGTYTNGDTATSIVVQPYDSTTASIDTATGTIKQIKYSTDGGTTWSTTPVAVNSTTGTFSFLVNGVTLTMKIAAKVGNKATDQYSFTLSKGNVASGDNAVLLGKRLKTDTSSTLGNSSLDGYYNSLIGTLGVQGQNAQRTVDNQQTLVDQINNWRESVSGVNLDEEMTNMIKFQKGYSAAARVLTTMDEMLDKLINGTGVVGR
ncbi:flagellar hook-associated protein FlgK [Sporomusa acidovorans]|uniref:Flagellar hook-associated protein 1 n=1 Tax=Sporomusa acidovorans (strain ATCC 49682 / DSM 3132 / Mol) TaxID=1123286 RepID=A0ABZ3J7E2_SPOA4|nr:flagellar hook-associated protein FlgK [Sporomusa acidovorans]OZC19410.1 flagellar hook-associated protein 1 [Sporomusa acidovorans DSM 3132]SDD77356.1 flagellar hook-associated protein 1 FlgK [Sporomusa acidovorans]